MGMCVSVGLAERLRVDPCLQELFRALLDLDPPLYKWTGVKPSLWRAPAWTWRECGKDVYMELVRAGIVKEYRCINPAGTVVECVEWDKGAVRDVVEKALREGETVEGLLRGLEAPPRRRLNPLTVEATYVNKYMVRLENTLREVNRRLAAAGLPPLPEQAPVVTVKIWSPGRSGKHVEIRREVERDTYLYTALQSALDYIKRKHRARRAHVTIDIDPRHVKIYVAGSSLRVEYSYSRGELNKLREKLLKTDNMPIHKLAYISLLASSYVAGQVHASLSEAIKRHVKALKKHASARRDIRREINAYIRKLTHIAEEMGEEYRRLVEKLSGKPAAEPPKKLPGYSEVYRALVESINKPLGANACYWSILLVALVNGAPLSHAVRAYRKFLEACSGGTCVHEVVVETRWGGRSMKIPSEVAVCPELLGRGESALASYVRHFASTHGLPSHVIRAIYVKHLLDQGLSVPDVKRMLGVKWGSLAKYIHKYTSPRGEQYVSTKKLVLEYLSRQQRPVKAREIAEAVGRKARTVTKTLYKMRDRGLVEKNEKGWVLKANN